MDSSVLNQSLFPDDLTLRSILMMVAVLSGSIDGNYVGAKSDIVNSCESIPSRPFSQS